MTCKGVVKGNIVLLEEGVHLPDGARVTVAVERVERKEEEEATVQDVTERQTLVARMKEFEQKLSGRHVNLGDLILEGREELENRA